MSIGSGTPAPDSPRCSNKPMSAHPPYTSARFSTLTEPRLFFAESSAASGKQGLKSSGMGPSRLSTSTLTGCLARASFMKTI